MFSASRLSILVLFLAGNLVATSSAQTTDSTAAAPAADPVDVESVDAIIAAVYDVISGPVGEARDWDRFRSLFLPGANLVPVFQNEQGGVQSMELTPEDYIRRSGEQLVAVGFTESEYFVSRNDSATWCMPSVRTRVSEVRIWRRHSSGVSTASRCCSKKVAGGLPIWRGSRSRWQLESSSRTSICRTATDCSLSRLAGQRGLARDFEEQFRTARQFSGILTFGEVAPPAGTYDEPADPHRSTRNRLLGAL